MPTHKYDPQSDGGQYLEDLATAYWYSEALFTALESGLFDILEETGGIKTEALAERLEMDADALDRFLSLLQSLGLIDAWEGSWFNNPIASTYLVKSSPRYQGGNVLWRKKLKDEWNTLHDVLKAGTRTHFPPVTATDEEMAGRRRDYLKAMDAVIMNKMPEVLPMFADALPRNADVLDVGAGSGGFSLSLLSKRPDLEADLMDIRQILPTTESLVREWPEAVAGRVSYCEENILDIPWKNKKGYDAVILSNIVHAYSAGESAGVIKEAVRHLNDDGLMIFHDFFIEHATVKSRLSDINMLVNTYNGRAFKGQWVIDRLRDEGLKTTPVIPLSTDTAVIFASRSAEALSKLTIDPVSRLIEPIKSMGFLKAIPFDPEDVVVSAFPRNKCLYGCDSSITKTCQSNRDMTLEETREMIHGYTKALLLAGEPPTGDFQQKCLKAEACAFKSGFYKAFVYWSGPCSICPDCDLSELCQNPKHHRPSLEGSGIDVFATVENAGEHIKTLKERGEYIKYYGLLLLE